MSEEAKQPEAATSKVATSIEEGKGDSNVQIADSAEGRKEDFKDDKEEESSTVMEEPTRPAQPDTSNLELVSDENEKDSSNSVFKFSLSPENDQEEVKQFRDSCEKQYSLCSKEEGCHNVPMTVNTCEELENIRLRANYFQLSFQNEKIYWYKVDVKLESETVECIQNRQQNRGIVSQMFQENEILREFKPIYDGIQNLYTNEPLPIEKSFTLDVTITENNEIRKYAVTVKPAVKKGKLDNIISLKASEENFLSDIRICDEMKTFMKTVLRPVDLDSEHSYVGKKFFFEDVDQPEGRVQIRMGYSHDIVLTHRGLIVILDISAAGFHKSQNFLEFVSDVLGRDITMDPVLTETEFGTLSRAITEVGLKVTSSYVPNVKSLKVKGLTKLSVRDMKLANESGTTVEELFHQKYGIKVKYRNLPCLQVVASTDSEFLPFEVCHIPSGVRMKGRLNYELESLMMKRTNLTPQERFDQIVRFAKLISEKSAPNMGLCGLQLDLEPFRVTGKVHRPPFIKYSSKTELDSTIPNESGKWMMKDDKQFLEAVRVKDWMLISFVNSNICNLESLASFADLLSKSGASCGLHMKEPVDIKIAAEDESTADVLLYAKEKNVDLVVVVLYSTTDVHYEEVKFIAELHLGLVTQCVTRDKVWEKRYVFVSNLCKKINSKMGGSNHAIYKDFGLSESPAIIFGARTSVPPTSVTSSTSFAFIASVVGSLDSHPFRYSASCRAQLKVKKNKWRAELIFELKDMVKKILMTFISKTNTKPKKIIFFRNGISDEHFEQLLTYEVPMIKKACEEIGSDYCPDLIYITVRKMRQIHFKLEGLTEEEVFNIPLGTTVDTDITSPSVYNYYICSHENNNGRSRPTSYTVLYHDNYFEREKIQQLCYHLCHTYACSNRCIAIPPPLKYAALAARRAGKYAAMLLKKLKEEEVDYEPEALTQKAMNLLKEIEQMDNGMFFV